MRDPLDPRLIRLLASRYHELQGLKTIANAAWPLGYAALLALGGSTWHVLLALPLVLAGFWFRFTWVRDRIEAFYESRCGRVAERAQALGHTWLFTQALALGSALMEQPPVLRVVFLLGSFTLYPLAAVVRDAPYRFHWLAPLLVGLVAALEHARLTTTEQGEAWGIRVAFAGGLAIAVAGLGDHRLLVRTLHAPPDEGSAPSGEPTESRT